MIILIPPSEGKAAGGDDDPIGKLPHRTHDILTMLKAYEGDLTKLYGVSAERSELAHKMNLEIARSPTMPAIKRYTGVVFQGLDYSTMNGRAKEWLDKHVRIVSAMFGLVAPSDMIPDYKLKIDKLQLAKHWYGTLSSKLHDEYVIDLLPNAHRKAVSYTSGKAVNFYFYDNGEKKPAGHHGKLIKGKFVRWLCEQRVTRSSQFSKFNIDGFRWNGNEFIKHV